MKIQKKYIIAGVLSVVSIAIGVAYLQYKKFMDYSVGFKSVKVRSLSESLFNFDLFLTFLKKAGVGFDIIEQEYEVYVNGKFATKMVNYSVTKVLPNATSILGVNVKFDPRKVLALLKESYVDILLNPKSVKIKIPIKMKVVFWGFKIFIPYVYEDTLKGLLYIYKASQAADASKTS